MKNSLKYLGLWQKKRSELKVSDDPQADWMQMHDLLDKHLPENGQGGGASHSKKFKLLPILLISLSAAAMTYFAARIVEIRKQRYQQHHSHHNRHRSGVYNDSMLNADSSLIKDSTSNNEDSIQALKQAEALQEGGTAKPGFDKTSKDSLSTDNKINKGSSSISKGNSSPALNNAGNNHLVANSSYQHNNNSSQAFLTNHQAKTNKPFPSRTQISNSLLNPGTNRSRNQSQRTRHATDHNTVDGENTSSSKNSGNSQQDAAFLTIITSKPVFNLSTDYPAAITVPFLNDKLIQNPSFSQESDYKKDGKGEKSGKVKNTRVKSSATPINLDWGFLTGVNSSGSFTAKKQNANFYGSLPVDLYFGLFATYNINDHWGLNTQLKLLNPQTLTGSYTHANESKVDSGQLLNITDTRKAYFVSIPLHVVYRATDILSFKAGPVINIPVKQVSGNSVLQPAGIRSDTSYYNKTIAILGQTQYTPKLNYGLSGGVSIHYQRLIFEATYLKGLSGQKVTSGLGSYIGYYNTFQFTIGFQLNKPKQ
jgi:hypothetical protein